MHPKWSPIYSPPNSQYFLRTRYDHHNARSAHPSQPPYPAAVRRLSKRACADRVPAQRYFQYSPPNPPHPTNRNHPVLRAPIRALPTTLALWVVCHFTRQPHDCVYCVCPPRPQALERSTVLQSVLCCAIRSFSAGDQRIRADHYISSELRADCNTGTVHGCPPQPRAGILVLLLSQSVTTSFFRIQEQRTLC
ncbi:hypothetical protein BLNAU_10882 [Blattamonas nauphoetae]|uniref:Uncharacterized protein n=1 Tax=Blattamonas nauphoetae TaxID=2049346 RepID=A0ABQ9XRM7_9EUKA|nr:hypothetical protein BLNAU_10882 [Blattamonas nauphoetae]